MGLKRKLLGNATLDLALALCGFSGCNGERAENVRVETMEQSPVFERMWKNPKEAILGKYNTRLNDELNGLMIEIGVRAGKDYATRDDNDTHFFDMNEKSGRGYKLADSLERSLVSKDVRKDNLLIVCAGAAHSYALGKRLQDKWNVYFYAEPSFVENFEDFRRIENFSSMFYQFLGKKEFEDRNSREKPNAIIYGDDHGKSDREFEFFVPTMDGLRSAGIRKIIFAQEDLVPGRGMSVARARSVSNFDKLSPLFAYLDKAKAAGIKVEVVGMACDYDHFVGEEKK